jgi:N-methylhydantoinase B
MRFSRNGYYIEAYVKCACCGQLIYGEPDVKGDDGKSVFCSEWCRDWLNDRPHRLEQPISPSSARKPVRSISRR